MPASLAKKTLEPLMPSKAVVAVMGHVILKEVPISGVSMLFMDEDILPYEKNIAIQIFGPLHFSNVD